MVTRRNKRGIRIKRCCASCKYKMILGDGERICTLGFESDETCRHWRMSNELRYCGTPFGVIKDREYLQHVLNIRYREYIDTYSHRAEQRDINEIRQEYLSKNKRSIISLGLSKNIITNF